jgi:hypothetical protein
MTADEYDAAVSEALASLVEMLDRQDVVNEKRIRDILDCLHGKVRETDTDAYKYLSKEDLDTYRSVRESLMKSLSTEHYKTMTHTEPYPNLKKSDYTYTFNKYPPNNSGDIWVNNEA